MRHNESTHEIERLCMNTHEETWVSDNLSINVTRIGADNREVIGAAVGLMTNPSAATLAARAPEMARLLLRIGLGVGGDEEDPLCGCCRRPVNGTWREHAPACALVNILRTAGVLGD